MQLEIATLEKRRPIPRPFTFPWGRGQIVEEAFYKGQNHEPVIQLLKFESGMEIVRFCSYTLSGKFERNSWIAGSDELSGIRESLKGTPRIRQLLLKLVD